MLFSRFVGLGVCLQGSPKGPVHNLVVQFLSYIAQKLKFPTLAFWTWWPLTMTFHAL